MPAGEALPLAIRIADQVNHDRTGKDQHIVTARPLPYVEMKY
jgi:hypothetical protein